MAVALSTRSRVSLSFRVSDVRERTRCCRTSLFNEGVVSSNAPSVRVLGFITRLVELLNRVRRIRWWVELGASEESGRCPQLPSVSCCFLFLLILVCSF